MFISSLLNWEKERAFAHPVLKDVIDRAKKIRFEELDTGKYDIQGDMVYFTLMELTAKAQHSVKAEKHERYLDIHFLLEGEETIGWASDTGTNTATESDPDKDYTLYDEVVGETYVRLVPGMYAVLNPQDIHRPGLIGTADAEPSRIRKAVVKIHRDLFG